jgi:hypothetical protein
MIHEEIRGEREEMMKRGGRVKCWRHEPVEQSCWPVLTYLEAEWDQKKSFLETEDMQRWVWWRMGGFGFAQTGIRIICDTVPRKKRNGGKEE